MNTEIIIEDENNHENVITTQMLQSVENIAVEITIDAIENKRRKKVFLIHNSYLILTLVHFYQSINQIQLKLFVLPAMISFQFVMARKMILIVI
jgi:hypothetical protein